MRTTITRFRSTGITHSYQSDTITSTAPDTASSTVSTYPYQSGTTTSIAWYEPAVIYHTSGYVCNKPQPKKKHFVHYIQKAQCILIEDPKLNKKPDYTFNMLKVMNKFKFQSRNS